MYSISILFSTQLPPSLIYGRTNSRCTGNGRPLAWACKISLPRIGHVRVERGETICTHFCKLSFVVGVPKWHFLSFCWRNILDLPPSLWAGPEHHVQLQGSCTSSGSRHDDLQGYRLVHRSIQTTQSTVSAGSNNDQYRFRSGPHEGVKRSFSQC